MILGDLNGHSPLWGSKKSSPRGQLVESILHELNLCSLNDGSPTYFHQQNGTQSCLDLSLCDSSLYLDFDWKVDDDLHGSDHFPILLRQTKTESQETHQHLNFKRANWDLYSAIVQKSIEEEKILGSQDPAEAFTNVILQSAKESIPSSSRKPQMPKTPWFSTECREAHKARKKHKGKFLDTQLWLTLKLTNNFEQNPDWCTKQPNVCLLYTSPSPRDS